MTATGRVPAFVCAVVLIAASSASAQAVFSGVVLDPNGDPVEGATIYLTNITTKSQLEFATLANGRFEFSGLPVGEYRVTSMTPAILPFTVTLPAGEPVRREIKIAFGPFAQSWTIVPANPLAAAGPRGRQAPDFRCAERGIQLCGPASLVVEFERDEIERLQSPVLAPRMAGMPQTDYPQALVAAKVEGTVRMDGRIGVDGTLIDLRATSADHPDLVPAAMASAASAKWDAARIRGVVVEVPMSFTVQFRLQPFLPGR